MQMKVDKVKTSLFYYLNMQRRYRWQVAIITDKPNYWRHPHLNFSDSIDKWNYNKWRFASLAPQKPGDAAKEL